MLALISILIWTGTLTIADLETAIFPPLPPAVSSTNNTLCQIQSDLYTENLSNFTLWATEMWDATAKAPTGVLRGSVFQMGHFEECLSAKAPFEAQYCLARIEAIVPNRKKLKDPISLEHDPNEFILDRLKPSGDVSQQDRNVIQVGWCVPASCTPQDLQEFLGTYTNDLDLPLKEENVTFKVSFNEALCNKNEELRLNGSDVCFCILTAILVLLVIGTTSYELSQTNYQKDEKPKKQTLVYRLLITFSAKKNFEDLKRMDDSNGALSVLYGMRTICILFIIMDHRFGTFTSSALLNFNYVETQYRAPLAPLLFHGDLFVDSFFLLSGLLVTYGLLNQFDKKIVHPGFIIFMRYVRLTPVYAFVIFYYATLFNYTGTGPLWKLIAGGDSQDCKDNWWANLLYLSNYINADHMCMTHSWYLPCDFHYFIIGIGVCLLIKKQVKLGLATLLLLTITSIVIPFILTIAYQRPALLLFYPDFLRAPKSHRDFLLTYSKSHTRATPYFIGMFAGYIYYKLKDTNKHVSRIKSYCILFISIFLVIISIIGGTAFYNPYHKYNALESATYAALHRPAFAIGSAGILFVASYGHAGFVYVVLSWWPWIPLSKLVYGAYLIHLQFQLRSAAKFMNPQQITYFDTISLSLSDMVSAFIAALGLYLAIEAPFRRIFRELFVPTERPREMTYVVENGNNESRL